MARPVVINDDLILNTAREVFLEKGLRATTAEIAERAGVSQGILFKRFKTKQALFKASMNIEENPVNPMPMNLQERAGVGSVEETLNEFGNHLAHKYLCIVPAAMMDWSNSREGVEQTHDRFDQGPERAARGIKMISSYLSAEVELGRIYVENPEILAQTFAGAIWHYAFLQVTLGEIHSTPLTQEQYVSGLVRILLQGIARAI